MIIRIEKSNLSADDKFTGANYPSSGVFMNTDDKGMKELFYVNIDSGFTYFMLHVDSNVLGVLKAIGEPEPKEAPGGLSEQFVLKLVESIKPK